jgi:hypothetical protein
VFTYDGGVVVHPHVFRSVLGDERSIVEYQVIQTARGAEILALGAMEDTGRIERALAVELGRLGVAAPSVRLVLVRELARQATGKLRRFVPLSVPRPSAAVSTPA